MATPKKDPSEYKKRGRPKKSEVPQELADRICSNISALAMSLSHAAECEGIHRQTALRWMEMVPDFALQVTRARAMAVKNLSARAIMGTPIRDQAGNITGYSMKGSAMAAFMLERRYRDEYGPVLKVGPADEDDFAGRSREELEELRDKIRVKRAAAAGKESDAPVAVAERILAEAQKTAAQTEGDRIESE